MIYESQWSFFFQFAFPVVTYYTLSPAGWFGQSLNLQLLMLIMRTEFQCCERLGDLSGESFDFKLEASFQSEYVFL